MRSHIFKRPTLGALASSFVGNEFEVLPFPKFAPNKFDGKFRKGGGLGGAEYDTQLPLRRVKAPLCKGSCQRSCLREKTQKNKPQGLFFLQRRGKLLTHSCFTVSF